MWPLNSIRTPVSVCVPRSEIEFVVNFFRSGASLGARVSARVVFAVSRSYMWSVCVVRGERGRRARRGRRAPSRPQRAGDAARAAPRIAKHAHKIILITTPLFYML